MLNDIAKHFQAGLNMSSWKLPFQPSKDSHPGFHPHSKGDDSDSDDDTDDNGSSPSHQSSGSQTKEASSFSSSGQSKRSNGNQKSGSSYQGGRRRCYLVPQATLDNSAKPIGSHASGHATTSVALERYLNDEEESAELRLSQISSDISNSSPMFSALATEDDLVSNVSDPEYVMHSLALQEHKGRFKEAIPCTGHLQVPPIGFSGFGFGIGDFFPLGQLALDVYKSCKTASKGLNNLSSEILSLLEILRTLRELQYDHYLPEWNQGTLAILLSTCRDVLQDVQAQAERRKSFKSDRKCMFLFDRLEWVKYDIDVLTTRLTRNRAMFEILVAASPSSGGLQSALTLAKLQQTDMATNKNVLVSAIFLHVIKTVFLRLLNHCNSITNRASVLDEAFKSRINYKIYYLDLTLEQILDIWKLNINRVSRIEEQSESCSARSATAANTQRRESAAQGLLAIRTFSWIFKNRKEPRVFKRKADWVRHENEQYRQSEWWTCQFDYCKQSCYRADNLLQHLVRHQKMLGEKNTAKDTIFDMKSSGAVALMYKQHLPSEAKCIIDTGNQQGNIISLAWIMSLLQSYTSNFKDLMDTETRAGFKNTGHTPVAEGTINLSWYHRKRPQVFHNTRFLVSPSNPCDVIIGTHFINDFVPIRQSALSRNRSQDHSPTKFRQKIAERELPDSDKLPPLVDLIFVHGLSGGCRKTWSKTISQANFWPQEWLTEDPGFKHSRFHTFGYNSELAVGKGRTLNLQELAKSLLGEINTPLHLAQADTRLILIGHSLGGLIVTNTYVREMKILMNETPPRQLSMGVWARLSEPGIVYRNRYWFCTCCLVHNSVEDVGWKCASCNKLYNHEFVRSWRESLTSGGAQTIESPLPDSGAKIGTEYSTCSTSTAPASHAREPVYDQRLDKFGRAIESHRQTQRPISTNIVIIGAGITGLKTALKLSRERGQSFYRSETKRKPAYADDIDEGKRKRVVSIICTLGQPKENTEDTINKLRKFGQNVVRMNFSHPPYEPHKSLIDSVCENERSKDCRRVPSPSVPQHTSGFTNRRRAATYLPTFQLPLLDCFRSQIRDTIKKDLDLPTSSKGKEKEPKYGAYYNAGAHLRRVHFKPMSKTADTKNNRKVGGRSDWSQETETEYYWMGNNQGQVSSNIVTKEQDESIENSATSRDSRYGTPCAPIPRSLDRTNGEVSLDNRYRVRNRDHKMFFKSGRVFSMLWTDPFVGATKKHDAQSLDHAFVAQSGQNAYDKIRRFIIVQSGDRFTTCLPVTTYGGSGVTKRGVKVSGHSVIYGYDRRAHDLSGVSLQQSRSTRSNRASRKLETPKYVHGREEEQDGPSKSMKARTRILENQGWLVPSIDYLPAHLPPLYVLHIPEACPGYGLILSSIQDTGKQHIGLDDQELANSNNSEDHNEPHEYHEFPCIGSLDDLSRACADCPVT